METLLIISAFLIGWAISAFISISKNKTTKQKIPKTKGKSHNGIPYKVIEHTREYDNTVYYTLALGRVGYPGQWVYPDPDGKDYSDNCMAASLKKYQSKFEAEIDAKFRIDKNIAAHKEYQSRMYTQNEM